MSRTARTPLEPITGSVVAVALAHVLLGMLLWIFLPLWKQAHPTKAGNALLDWKSPDDFLLGRMKEPVPAKLVIPSPARPPEVKRTSPPVAPAAAAPSAPALAPIPATRQQQQPTAPPKEEEAGPPAPVIPAPPQPPVSIIPADKYISVSSRSGDFAGRMGTVDEAVQKVYLREWIPPPLHLVPSGKRSGALLVSINREGIILETKLDNAADATALDTSIQDAAKRVLKIPVTLPSSFSKERYDLQVNFLIE